MLIAAVIVMLHAAFAPASEGGHAYRDYDAERELLRGLTRIGLEVIYRSCGPSSALANGAEFMRDYGRQLPGLLLPGATCVSCQPSELTRQCAAYMLRARLASGTNEVQMTVRLQYNQQGLITALAFDRPLTLANDVIYPAGAPVPIEPLMHALARRRMAPAPITETLTVISSRHKSSYANSDVAKARVSCLFSGSVPTTRTSFDGIRQFNISPMPIIGQNMIVHVLWRKVAGTRGGNRPRYTHLFCYSNATEKTKPFGYFVADIRGDRMNFVYTFKLNNRNKTWVVPAEFEAARAYLATNPPIRGLGFGLLRLTIDDHVHTATNVPVLYRVTKGSTSARNVRVRPSP